MEKAARGKDREEVERVTRALKTIVQIRNIPHRYIEAQMGLSTGYLSRIFSGKVVLRLEHILGVCRAVMIPPGAFFEAVYPPVEYEPEIDSLIAALQQLLPGEEKMRRLGKVQRQLGAIGTELQKPLELFNQTVSNPPTSQLRRLAEALLEELNYFDEKKRA